MKALLSREPGGPETLTLETVPDPVPGPGEVLVSMRACGVNYPDVLVIEDRYQFRPQRPFAPGAEIAGVVEAVGKGVTTLKAGDAVIASVRMGGMAEKAVAEAARCLTKPASMPFDEAAAFVLTYSTTIHALRDRAALQAGETLLVLGAAGGVGIAAIELGKAMGARVVAAVSTPEKLNFVMEQGADDALIYPTGALDRTAARDLSAQFKALCGGDGADVVYDAVGGDYAEPAFRAIAPEGRYLVIGFPAGIASLPMNLPLLKNASLVGVFWGDFVKRRPERHAQNMRELFQLYEDGAIRPRIGARFALKDGAKAIARLRDRAALGKIVVTTG
ncbi:NADPH:quinone oxidoreductase family protein [Aureimonas mangrovi]|uniref:NADPH:quinone oxidoreductase family protein n=1 Tax=Aureimonas mangrovi TaxID=2758041 RepID=UPI00163DD84F|nr:NADPH:quinone oxidoreductase family protein [Aureimonas mangrovi]